MFIKRILVFFLIVYTQLWTIFAVSNNDLLNQIMQPAHNNQTVLDQEANDVFDDSASLNLTPWEDIIQKNESILVKTTRFMVRIAILFGVPMIIWSGIKIAMSLGDEGKLKENLIEILYVWAGIVIALLAVMIIYIIASATRGSLWVI
jgi:hypothetical protein